MSKVKKLKVMQPDGNLSDYIDIGADAKNITLENGQTAEEAIMEALESPTVPEYVKEITEQDIENWNHIYWNVVE